MALSRIRCSRDISTVLSRYTYPACGSVGENHVIRDEFDKLNSSKIGKKTKGLHVTGVRRYPEAPRLPLPNNVSEIFGNETGRFTPERSRDITAPVLAYVTGTGGLAGSMKGSFDTSNWGAANTSCGDTHVNSYDCFGAVSLNSSMQSNVPIPFCSSGKASHFNMPGGQWAKDSKYIAEDMQKAHYKSVKARESERKQRGNGILTNAVIVNLTPMSMTSRHVSPINFSTDSSVSAKDSKKIVSNATATTTTTPITDTSDETVNAAVSLTRAEKLKKAVKDYGSTVIVFHVGISLISLGVCYAAVSSGLDVGAIVKMISTGTNERVENAMANSSTFLIAYAVHKIFAPIRISITLGSTPFLVRYLRRIGILKMPKT